MAGLITVAAGQPIRATHVNQFSRWLTGVTKDITTSLTTTHATEYTLTVTNEETSAGNAVKIVSGSSTIALFNKTGVTFNATAVFSGGFSFGTAPLLLNNGTLAAPSLAFSTDTNTGRRWVQADYMADVVGGVDVQRYASGPYFGRSAFGNFVVAEPLVDGSQDGTVLISGAIVSANNDGIIAFAPSVVNNGRFGASGSATSAPDSAAIQASLYQTATTAGGGGRVIAAQAIRSISTTTGTAGTLSGIEIGVSTLMAGRAFETLGGRPLTMGLWVASTHEATLGTAPALEADCGIYIGGHDNGDGGWRYPIFARDKSGVNIFSVHSTGTIRMAQGGNAGGPILTFDGDTDTGFWRIGANGFGLSTAGVERLRVDGNGDFAIGNTSCTAGTRLLITGGMLDVDSNIQLSGAARRILIDGSNATTASRTYFQDKTTNSSTFLGVIPNGTATTAGVQIVASSTVATAAVGQFQVNATSVDLSSTRNGTATYLPLTFGVSGTEAARFATTGLLTANFGIQNAGPWSLTNVISPAVLTTATNDWNPTGLTSANVIRVSTTASQNLTGIVSSGMTGRVLQVCYIGAAALVFKNNTGSTAANVFFTPGGVDYTLSANGSCEIWYDAATPCWRILDNA